MCGGTPSVACSMSVAAGLSPRVRGNLTSAHDNWSLDRSIPACAGEPGMGFRAGRRGRVYPRVCGGTPTARPA